MENQVYQIGTKKEGEKKMAVILEVLKGMSKESALYWVNAMVKDGELTQGEAGHIIVHFNL